MFTGFAELPALRVIGGCDFPFEWLRIRYRVSSLGLLVNSSTNSAAFGDMRELGTSRVESRDCSERGFLLRAKLYSSSSKEKSATCLRLERWDC